MELHQYPEKLYYLIRDVTELVTQGTWATVDLVLFNAGSEVRVAARATAPDGTTVDPLPPRAAIEVRDLAGSWLDALGRAGQPEFRALLLRAARETGHADLRALRDEDPEVEAWDPTPETFNQVLDRVPIVLGR